MAAVVTKKEFLYWSALEWGAGKKVWSSPLLVYVIFFVAKSWKVYTVEICLDWPHGSDRRSSCSVGTPDEEGTVTMHTDWLLQTNSHAVTAGMGLNMVQPQAPQAVAVLLSSSTVSRVHSPTPTLWHQAPMLPLPPRTATPLGRMSFRLQSLFSNWRMGLCMPPPPWL